MFEDNFLHPNFIVFLFHMEKKLKTLTCWFFTSSAHSTVSEITLIFLKAVPRHSLYNLSGILVYYCKHLESFSKKICRKSFFSLLRIFFHADISFKGVVNISEKLWKYLLIPEFLSILLILKPQITVFKKIYCFHWWRKLNLHQQNLSLNIHCFLNKISEFCDLQS